MLLHFVGNFKFKFAKQFELSANFVWHCSENLPKKFIKKFIRSSSVHHFGGDEPEVIANP